MTDMPDNPLGEEILDEIELADAERFADALDRIDAGGEPDLDPREDPTLTALAVLTEDLHEVELRATSTARYASYRARSRDYLLHRVERERMALAAAHAASDRRPDRRDEPSRGWGIPFLRLNVLSHFATAAAAAVVVLAFVVMAAGGNTPAAAPEQVAAVDTPGHATGRRRHGRRRRARHRRRRRQRSRTRPRASSPRASSSGAQIADLFAQAVDAQTRRPRTR